MGDPVALPIALLVGLATAYCLARCAVPRWRHGHGVGVDAWHVLMGAAMVAMLLAPVGGRSATVQATVFGIGALWCGCLLLARAGTGAHARLGAACAVMAAMLMPAVVLAPASTAAVPAEHHHVPGMDMSGMDMSGMDMSAGVAAAPTGHAMAMPPGWLAAALLVAVVALAAAVVRAAYADHDRRTPARLSLACEAVMAGAMGYMAALALV